MLRCDGCGHEITSPKGRCPHCGHGGYGAKIEVETPALRPLAYWANDCVMCGVEYGVRLRADGEWYCAVCWQAWNG